MDSLRLDTLASHLVAWHNGHRLARRITAAHVNSVGYVVLPFAPAPGAAAAAPWTPAPLLAPEAPPFAAGEPVVEPASAPAPGLAAPVPAGGSDEPIEVLLDPTDIDLATVRGLEPQDAGVEAESQQTPDTPADAPVDIAFDETLTAATAAAEAAPPPVPDPVADPGQGATLRERAMARAQQTAQHAAGAAAAAAQHPAAPPVRAAALETPGATAPATKPAAPSTTVAVAPLTPLFSEDFIPPLHPSAVADFALRHGAAHASPGKDGLVRVVKPDPDKAIPVVEQRWLLTAQIDIGGQRTRLLVGTGPSPAVMGQRLSRLPRLAMLAAAPLALAAAGVWWLWPAATQPAAKSAAPLAGAADAAAAASAATAASAPRAGPSASASAAAAASAPVDAAPAAQASASAPADVEPTLGRVELPSLGPIVDDRRRAAAAAAEAKSAAAAGAAIEQVQKSVPPPAVVGPAFAVSTRLLRTRSESEQLAEAMRALLTGVGPPGLQVQALRSGEDWRVVVWPFTEQAQAEKARALLASRGMKVAVIDF